MSYENGVFLSYENAPLRLAEEFLKDRRDFRLIDDIIVSWAPQDALAVVTLLCRPDLHAKSVCLFRR